MTEVELKFIVDATTADAIEAGWRGHRSRVETIESRYFDSEDRALARAGASLRLRRRRGRWEQTLKLAATGGVARREDTVPRPGRFAGGAPEVDLGLHAADAVRAALAAASDGGRGGLRLRHVHTSLVRRRIVDVASDDARVEVALDRGELRAAAGSQPVCEVELELKAGSPAALVRLAEAGIARHALVLSTSSKAERGDRLAHGIASGEPRKATRARLDRESAPAVLVRSLLATAFDAIVANASEIAHGEWAAEHVHQLRVAIRRLRTVVRELGELDTRLDTRFEAPLGQAFRSLGAWRDRTHVADAMRAELTRAAAPEPELQPPADASGADPRTVVRDAAFQEALVVLAGATIEVSDAREVADAPRAARADVREAIGRRLDKLHRALRRAARDFERVDDAERHRVRRRLKRLRYLADMVGSLYRPRAVRRYLDAIEPAQDALGAYVDLVVAVGLARQAAEAGRAAAWFSAGWLAAQRESRAGACVEALHAAADAAPFWR